MLINSATINDALIVLQELDEDYIRREVVGPLLRKLGRTHIQCIHGHNERGKDFVYIVPDCMAGDQLFVCQVKATKISGSSTSSDGINAILNQLEFAFETEVLNPITCTKELPCRVEFISTFPIPDGVTGDFQHRFSKLRQKVNIIPPERLAELVLQHLPHIVSRGAAGEKSIIGAIRKLVEQNHEAIAFSGNTEDLVSSLFVEPVCHWKKQSADRITEGEVFGRWSNVVVPIPIQQAINHLWLKMCGNELVEIGTETSTDKFSEIPDENEPDEKLVTSKLKELRQIKIKEKKLILKDLELASKSYSKGPKKSRRKAGSSIQASKNVCSFLDYATTFVNLIRYDVDIGWAEFFEHLFEKELANINISFNEVLESDCDIVVTGGAGFGKTFLTRMVALSLIDRECRCFFVPCREFTGNVDLRGSICRFIENLSGVPTKDVIPVLDDLDILVLDGCDEAVTFPEELGAQINDLLAIGTFKEANIQTCPSEPFIPKVFGDRIVFDRAKKRLILTSRLSPSEWEAFIACNRDEDSDVTDSAVQRLFENAKRISPKKLLLASRSVFGMGLHSNFTTVALCPFSDSQRKSFFQKRLAKGDLNETLKFLESNPRVAEVANSPMMAAIIAGLKSAGVPLPASRIEIYEKRFDLLVSTWDAVRKVDRNKVINRDDKMKLLQQVAFLNHSKNRQLADKSVFERAWEPFARYYSSIRLEAVLEELVEKDSVLFECEQESYSFGHLSYQEFLCGRHLVYAGKAEYMGNRLGTPWWDNVAIFYSGISSNIEPVLKIAQTRGLFATHRRLISEMVRECRSIPSSFSHLMDELLNK